jgi:carboxylesterase type B
LKFAQRIFLRTVFAMATLMLSAGSALAAINAPVRIEAGLVQGVPAKDMSITVYKGIPFAAPPVGELRWKAPQPAIPWRGVRKADQFGNLCPQPQQPGANNANNAMSEDCLFLNVWTGASAATERRPVFVWIYGGGFSGGSGSSPQFDGENLARKGLVVVTFNYRLGALGFLATPELSKESGHNASGNYGLLDDVAVLKWVQKNIAAFGGDPGRVTLGGQSAGAGSVGFMAMSPLAKGLFQRGIAESHARYPRDLELRYLSVSHRLLKSAEQAGLKFATAHDASSLQQLRALPWQKLLEGSDVPDDSVYTGSGAKPPMFRPVVDGWVIPANYTDTYAKGAQNAVVYMAGSNLDETGAVPEVTFAAIRAAGAATRPGAPSINVTLNDSNSRIKFGPMTDEFLKLYPATNDDEAAHASNAAARDNTRVSTYLWGIEWTKHVSKPVYTYYWTHRSGPDRDTRGAFHGAEINFVFNNLYPANRPWTDEDRKIADRMSSYWANYITTGNPNGPGLPEWKAYDPKSPTVMQLGAGWGPMPVAEPAKIDFWKRFFQTHDAW